MLHPPGCRSYTVHLEAGGIDGVSWSPSMRWWPLLLSSALLCPRDSVFLLLWPSSPPPSLSCFQNSLDRGRTSMSCGLWSWPLQTDSSWADVLA